MVSNGAYKLTEHVVNEKVVYERNPMYWDNKNTILENSIEPCDDDCCDEYQSKLYRIFDYGFIKLPQDIASPLIIGIITAALIYYFI